MSAPDLAPGRVEELLRGAPPETAREAVVERLVRELRGGAAVPSPALRERVRAIGERRVARRRRPPTRALALAAAALVAVSFGGYALTRSTGGDDAGHEAARGDVAVVHGETDAPGGADASKPPGEAEAGGEVLREESARASPPYRATPRAPRRSRRGPFLRRRPARATSTCRSSFASGTRTPWPEPRTKRCERSTVSAGTSSPPPLTHAPVRAARG